MNLGESYQVKDLAVREFRDHLSIVTRTHDSEWVIAFRDHPEVVILDSQLKQRRRVDLQAQDQRYCRTSVALSRDRRWFGVSVRTELRIVNRNGKVVHRIPHRAWGEAGG